MGNFLNLSKPTIKPKTFKILIADGNSHTFTIGYTAVYSVLPRRCQVVLYIAHRFSVADREETESDSRSRKMKMIDVRSEEL